MATYTLKESLNLVIATPPNNMKTIIYMYSHAFTVCDCGKDIVLSQKAWGKAKYTGECKCGLKMELCNGKFLIHPKQT